MLLELFVQTQMCQSLLGELVALVRHIPKFSHPSSHRNNRTPSDPEQWTRTLELTYFLRLLNLFQSSTASASTSDVPLAFTTTSARYRKRALRPYTICLPLNESDRFTNQQLCPLFFDSDQLSTVTDSLTSLELVSHNASIDSIPLNRGFIFHVPLDSTIRSCHIETVSLRSRWLFVCSSISALPQMRAAPTLLAVSPMLKRIQSLVSPLLDLLSSISIWYSLMCMHCSGPNDASILPFRQICFALQRLYQSQLVSSLHRSAQVALLRCSDCVDLQCRSWIQSLFPSDINLDSMGWCNFVNLNSYHSSAQSCNNHPIDQLLIDDWVCRLNRSKFVLSSMTRFCAQCTHEFTIEALLSCRDGTQGSVTCPLCQSRCKLELIVLQSCPSAHDQSSRWVVPLMFPNEILSATSDPSTWIDWLTSSHRLSDSLSHVLGNHAGAAFSLSFWLRSLPSLTALFSNQLYFLPELQIFSASSDAALASQNLNIIAEIRVGLGWRSKLRISAIDEQESFETIDESTELPMSASDPGPRPDSSDRSVNGLSSIMMSRLNNRIHAGMDAIQRGVRANLRMSLASYPSSGSLQLFLADEPQEGDWLPSSTSPVSWQQPLFTSLLAISEFDSISDYIRAFRSSLLALTRHQYHVLTVDDLEPPLTHLSLACACHLPPRSSLFKVKQEPSELGVLEECIRTGHFLSGR